MLNVWDKNKRYFSKGYLVLGPTYTNFPFPTTLDGNTSIRLEFSAIRGVKLPNHAVGYSVLDSSAAATTYNTYAGARTPVQLSRKFENGYVLAAVERVKDVGSALNEYTWNYLCQRNDLTTPTSLVLRDTPTAGTGNQLVVYYAYTSTTEQGGYSCQTS
jgi:hypothetical protein